MSEPRLTKRDFFLKWAEANKNEWWFISDSWAACEVYNSHLLADASAIFPCKNSGGQIADINKYHGINEHYPEW